MFVDLWECGYMLGLERSVVGCSVIGGVWLGIGCGGPG